MLNCILIDDEPKALTTLEYELQQLDKNIEILGKYTDAAAAASFLAGHSVDVVFLDVEMPGMDGFSFLDKFKDRSFEVVFTTAYDKYALKAIRIDVVDYLVKPIDPEDLLQTILKLEKKLQRREDPSIKILEALDKLNEGQGGAKKIKLYVDRKIVFLDPEEIVYCESDGNYSRVFLEGRKEIFLTQKLKYLEEILPEQIFYRVHNSYIINLMKIKEFHKNDNYFILTNNVSIPVSRQRRNDIMDVL
jgi:two-component system LytT family response regulator